MIKRMIETRFILVEGKTDLAVLDVMVWRVCEGLCHRPIISGPVTTEGGERGGHRVVSTSPASLRL